jgi:hypothetical protein
LVHRAIIGVQFLLVKGLGRDRWGGGKVGGWGEKDGWGEGAMGRWEDGEMEREIRRKR